MDADIDISTSETCVVWNGYVYVYVYVYVCVCLGAHIYIYIYIHIDRYSCVYVSVYTHMVLWVFVKPSLQVRDSPAEGLTRSHILRNIGQGGPQIL